MKKLVALIPICAVIMNATLISCDRQRPAEENPLLTEWTTPFGVPPFDLIRTEHYMPAFEEAMRRHAAEADSIANNPAEPGFDNVVLALDESGELLDRVSNVFFMVVSAEATPEMQQVQEKIVPMLSSHADSILMNERLFGKVRSVWERRGELGLDELQARLLEKTYRRFVRAGAALSPEEKEELKDINERLALASFRFGANLLAENAGFVLEIEDSQAAGLPSSAKSAAREAAKKAGKPGKLLFTTSKPSMLPFLTYADDRGLREKLYRGYIERGNHDDANDNKALVNEIAGLRNRRAHMLGYPSHAAYMLDDKMARNPENVYELLDAVWTPALDKAREELSDMQEIKKRETGNDDFQPWDWWYYAEKLRKKRYSLNEDELRPYFSLTNVQTGVFGLANRLYGVTFRPINVPVYHPEVSAYEVLDADGSHLGVVYLDMFPRPGKGAGAWCGEYRIQSYRGGEKVTPVIGIVANFTRPAGTAPALLSLDETETFFHEFGHALHGLFKDVPYRGLSDVEQDFVELPSQIMENWAVEPRMLRSYAVHYQSGKVIPDYLIDRIRESARFNQGFATTELAAAALSDMDIHVIENFEPLDVNAFEKEMLADKRGLIPQIEPRYRYPYFAHIFDGGYAAGYYGYLWAEVLDKDAYEAFRETGDVFDRKTAARFRREVLSRGGEADGMTLYVNFRGAEPSRDPLLRSRGFMEPLPEPQENSLRRLTRMDELEPPMR